jgi:hypothetical protein
MKARVNLTTTKGEIDIFVSFWRNRRMRTSLGVLALTAIPVFLNAQSIVVPDSSVEHPGDAGIRSHTHFLIRATSNSSTPSGETPQSIRAVYNLPSTGGSGMIAIVDAFDYPTAEADLGTFSAQFGLPACTTANGCFSIQYASGTQPSGNCGWNQEALLARLNIQTIHSEVQASFPEPRICGVRSGYTIKRFSDTGCQVGKTAKNAKPVRSIGTKTIGSCDLMPKRKPAMRHVRPTRRAPRHNSDQLHVHDLKDDRVSYSTHLCAQSEPNSDLPHTLPNGVGDQSVCADQAAKNRTKQHIELPARPPSSGDFLFAKMISVALAAGLFGPANFDGKVLSMESRR